MTAENNNETRVGDRPAPEPPQDAAAASAPRGESEPSETAPVKPDSPPGPASSPDPPAAPEAPPPESKPAGDRVRAPELRRQIEKIEQRAARRQHIDHPAIIIGVGFAVVMLWSGWKLVFPTAPPPPPTAKPVDWTAIIRGRVREVEGGKVEILYDLRPRAGATHEWERFPQHNDWEYKHRLPDGAFAGEAFCNVYFDGDVLIEFDARAARGRTRLHELEFNPQICYANIENYYEFSINTVGRAVIRHHSHRGMRTLQDSRSKPIEKLKIHRIAFELRGRRLIGRLDGKVICDVEVPSEEGLSWGRVALRCRESVAIFSKIRIVGRPSEEWVRQRQKMIETLRRQRPSPAPAARPAR